MRTTCLSRKWLAVLATRLRLPSGAHSSALSDFHRELFDGRRPPLPRARTDDRSTLADRLAHGRSSGARRCRSPRGLLRPSTKPMGKGVVHLDLKVAAHEHAYCRREGSLFAPVFTGSEPDRTTLQQTASAAAQGG